MRHFIARSLVGLCLVASANSGCGGADGSDLVQPPPPPPSADISFAPIAGRWTGTLNDNGGAVFTTLFLLEKGNSSTTIGTSHHSYPSGFTCGGSLYPISALGDRYSAVERMTSNAGCSSEGTMKLRHIPSDDTLSFQWYAPISGILAVTGILTRS